MKNNIIIKEVPIDEAIKVDETIIEFGKPYTKEKYQKRYKGRKKLIIVAYYNKTPAGYLVGYDKFRDDSFYCWMAGVDPRYRRKGILKKLMIYQEKWAKEKGFKSIKITTRNSRRKMLSYLIKYDFWIVGHRKCKKRLDDRILLEKKI